MKFRIEKIVKDSAIEMNIIDPEKFTLSDAGGDAIIFPTECRLFIEHDKPAIKMWVSDGEKVFWNNYIEYHEHDDTIRQHINNIAKTVIIRNYKTFANNSGKKLCKEILQSPEAKWFFSGLHFIPLSEWKELGEKEAIKKYRGVIAGKKYGF